MSNAYTGGDVVRDLFRNKLDAIIRANSIQWRQVDGINVPGQPDAQNPYFVLEFLGGSEDQYSFGSPGNNFFLEIGQVNVRVVTPKHRSVEMRRLAEAYAAIIRNSFRSVSMQITEGHDVRVERTMPLGDGFTEGGMWTETIGLEYRVYNTG